MRQILALLLSFLFAHWQIPVPILGAPTHATLFYGYGCAGTSTNTCTVGGSSATTTNGFTSGIRITTGSNAAGYNLVACGVNIGATVGSGFLACAVYDNNNTGSNPIAYCTTSSTIALTTANAWNENATFGNCNLSPSTTYTIVWQLNQSATTIQYDATGTRYVSAWSSFGVFSSGVTWSTSSFTYSQYIRVLAN
jgi:hypothetical protein